MSATVAREGGRVQLEQSDMCLALNKAKMAEGRSLHAGIVETQFVIKKPRTKVREVKMPGVQFRWHKQVKASIARHLAMLGQNHTAGCHPCQNGTAKNLQTRCRCNGIGAPPPDRLSQPTPELTPPHPEMPPALTWNDSGAQFSQIVNLPAKYAYSHTSRPFAEFFTLDASAQDSQHDTDFDLHMLTDNGTSTG